MAIVRLKTFLNWQVEPVIGYVEKDECVERIWCKLCAKHDRKVSASLRGKALVDFHKYVEGTKFVSKHTVMRHIKNSSAHLAAVEFEKLEVQAKKADGDGDPDRSSVLARSNTSNTTVTRPRQPGILGATQLHAREAYR